MWPAMTLARIGYPHSYLAERKGALVCEQFRFCPEKFPETGKNSGKQGETGSPAPASSARESASNRCVFVVSSLAGIVLKLPRVSYPAKASAATRDAKCLGAGRERPQGLSRPFSSRRMWSVSAGF